MKNLMVLATLLLLFSNLFAQKRDKDEIWLLVRGDDIGSTHAANVGCIESYKNGIMRSVELMVPCPWFPEAVKLLNDNPGLDAGLHLVLTSEWENIKWRPLTHCPSLVDDNGFFFPMVWQQKDFPAKTSLQSSSWKIEEIEQELRAQIEMGLRNVPHISHMGGHMGFESLDPKIQELTKRLAIEYKIEINEENYGVGWFNAWGKAKTVDERIEKLTQNLQDLKPGVYIFVDHPAIASAEMEGISHIGYNNVSADRDAVTKVWTSEKIKAMITSRKIKLISYKDLK